MAGHADIILVVGIVQKILCYYYYYKQPREAHIILLKNIFYNFTASTTSKS